MENINCHLTLDIVTPHQKSP